LLSTSLETLLAARREDVIGVLPRADSRDARNTKGFFCLVDAEKRMVTIDEEIEAAKQTQAVLSRLSTSSAPDSNVVAALRKAKDVAAHAISIFPGEAPLNDARTQMVYALYGLLRGPITQEKIDNAKGAIGVWTLRLLGSVK
jgi:hypothetical protein